MSRGVHSTLEDLSQGVLADQFSRPLRSLRLSVTDRCNLRCGYCMPQEKYVWLPREELLRFEEIARLVEVFTSLGVQDVRLTGGEPLLRRDLPKLVSILARNAAIRDLSLTTNGVLLGAQAADLRAAGLGRVTVSLDTLRPERFAALTGRDAHAQVLEGISAARRHFGKLKLDVVVIRGINDDELPELIEFGREAGSEVRFIEYMDVGGATDWTPGRVFSRAEILESLAACYGPIQSLRENSSAPAERFQLADGTIFGIIASTTTPFCRSCDRSRLTADGLWYLCLYAHKGIDLRQWLRSDAAPEEMAARIAKVWQARNDRGAEARLAAGDRGVFIGIDQLRLDPHLEMHTRGG